MRRGFALLATGTLAAGTLAACGNDPAEPGAAPARHQTAPPISGQPPSTSPAPAPAPASLAGEWRVAGIGDEEINLPHGITASVSRDRITITSSCVVLGWRYTYADGRLHTEALPGQGCERTLDATEQRLLQAITQATGARTTPANGVELYGTGEGVLLFSQ